MFGTLSVWEHSWEIYETKYQYEEEKIEKVKLTTNVPFIFFSSSSLFMKAFLDWLGCDNN